MTMNISEFANDISSGNTADMIKQYFDEVMVLYNVIGHRDEIKIVSTENTSVAQFNILANSNKDAEILYSKLNGRYFNIYNTKFLISMALNENSIITNISKY